MKRAYDNIATDDDWSPRGDLCVRCCLPYRYSWVECSNTCGCLWAFETLDDIEFPEFDVFANTSILITIPPVGTPTRAPAGTPTGVCSPDMIQKQLAELVYNYQVVKKKHEMVIYQDIASRAKIVSELQTQASLNNDRRELMNEENKYLKEIFNLIAQTNALAHH